MSSDHVRIVSQYGSYAESLLDSGPLDRSDCPPYFAELTLERQDGTTRKINVLDKSILGPQAPS